MKKSRIFDQCYNTVLSEYFIALRKERKRTLEDVAYFVGCNANSLYRYETGSREMPIDIFVKLCRFYGVDYEQAFTEINEKALLMAIREMRKFVAEERQKIKDA